MVAVVALVLAVTRAIGASDVGVRFGIGYFSHLPTDALSPAIVPGEAVDLGYLIWPLASAALAESRNLLARAMEIPMEFSRGVTGANGWRFLFLDGLLAGLTLALWIADGRPGLRLVWPAGRSRSGQYVKATSMKSITMGRPSLSGDRCRSTQL